MRVPVPQLAWPFAPCGKLTRERQQRGRTKIFNTSLATRPANCAMLSVTSPKILLGIPGIAFDRQHEICQFFKDFGLAFMEAE